jgi:hypothetical protein
MPGLPKHVLADHIIQALGSDLLSHGSTADVPLDLNIRGLVPVVVYAFTVSDPPGGRDADELKIQLIVPGQVKKQRADFDSPNGAFIVLLGYSPGHNVFVLWDAYKHKNFAYSKNCQVRLAEIKDAQISGIGHKTRVLGDGASERIIVARPDHLAKAIGERIRTP